MKKFTGDGRSCEIVDDLELLKTYRLSSFYLNKCFIKLNSKSEIAVASYGHCGFLPENKQRLVVSI